MRILGLIAATSTLVAACGSRDPAPAAEQGNGSAATAVNVAEPGSAAPAAGGEAEAGWDLRSSGEGVALVIPASGAASMRLFCPAGSGKLLVNVPGFRAVGSEERLSFGSGGEAVALVADSRGDVQRGGVSGTGPVPANLDALVGGPISASYGAQRSGPHPAPPAALSSAFAAACREGAASKAPAAPPASPAAAAGPCLVQDNKPIEVAALRAVGTEPFWNARIEGRCVTYSHPEDQKGTRIWTRFTPARGGGTWSGSLGGRPFELRIRPGPGCSDGMSDRRYPLAAELNVAGERRQGCAAPG
jgi:uncharacterized membrane protein